VAADGTFDNGIAASNELGSERVIVAGADSGRPGRGVEQRRLEDGCILRESAEGVFLRFGRFERTGCSCPLCAGKMLLDGRFRWEVYRFLLGAGLSPDALRRFPCSRADQ